MSKHLYACDQVSQQIFNCGLINFSQRKCTCLIHRKQLRNSVVVPGHVIKKYASHIYRMNTVIRKLIENKASSVMLFVNIILYPMRYCLRFVENIKLN